jgi:hypothetical protein
LELIGDSIASLGVEDFVARIKEVGSVRKSKGG